MVQLSENRIMENVRGCYLQDILEEHKLSSIFVERGKVMVMQVGINRFFFEMYEDFTYHNRCRNLIKATSGTVLDSDGNLINDKDYMVVQYVRFPTDTELEWYEKQDTV